MVLLKPSGQVKLFVIDWISAAFNPETLRLCTLRMAIRTVNHVPEMGENWKQRWIEQNWFFFFFAFFIFQTYKHCQDMIPAKPSFLSSPITYLHIYKWKRYSNVFPQHKKKTILFGLAFASEWLLLRIVLVDWLK